MGPAIKSRILSLMSYKQELGWLSSSLPYVGLFQFNSWLNASYIFRQLLCYFKKAAVESLLIITRRPWRQTACFIRRWKQWSKCSLKWGCDKQHIASDSPSTQQCSLRRETLHAIFTHKTKEINIRKTKRRRQERKPQTVRLLHQRNGCDCTPPYLTCKWIELFPP